MKKKYQLKLLVKVLILGGLFSSSSFFFHSFYQKNFNQFNELDFSFAGKVKNQISLVKFSDLENSLKSNDDFNGSQIVNNKIIQIEKNLQIHSSVKKKKSSIIHHSYKIVRMSDEGRKALKSDIAEIKDSLIEVRAEKNLSDLEIISLTDENLTKDFSSSLLALIEKDNKDKEIKVAVKKNENDKSPFLKEEKEVETSEPKVIVSRDLAAVNTQSIYENILHVEEVPLPFKEDRTNKNEKQNENKIVDETKLIQSKSLSLETAKTQVTEDSKVKDDDLIFLSDNDDRAKEYNEIKIADEIKDQELLESKISSSSDRSENKIKIAQELIPASPIEIESAKTDTVKENGSKIVEGNISNEEPSPLNTQTNPEKSQALVINQAAQNVPSSMNAVEKVIENSISKIAAKESNAHTQAFKPKVESIVSSSSNSQIKIAKNSIPGVSSLGAFQLVNNIYLEARDSLSERLSLSSSSPFDRSLKMEVPATYHLSAYSVKIGKGVIGDNLNNFDFRPSYALDEILPKDFKVKLHDEFSSIGGTVDARGFAPIRLNVALQKGRNLKHLLPLFDDNTFFNYVEGHGIDRGGYVLIENNPDQGLIDVVIEDDASLVKKICLNEQFKEEKNKAWEQCDFILLMGVDPGLRLLSYNLNFKGKNEIVSRLIPINEGEIYYDFFDIRNIREEKIALYEDQVAGSRPSTLLTRDSDSLESYTHFNKKVKKSVDSNNQFEMINILTPVSGRHYLIFKDASKEENNEIYIGKGSAQKIIIPSPRYRKNMREHFLSEGALSETGCIVQINLPSENDYEKTKLRRILANMDSPQGGDLKILYLDQEGGLFDDLVGTAKKVFILAENPGAIDIKIDYQNKTQDYFQTYCGENTYMVEQL